MCRSNDFEKPVRSRDGSERCDPPVTRRQALRYGVLLGAAALAGCQSAQTAKPSLRPVSTEKLSLAPIKNDDACATRLQDSICEALMFYYLKHHQLPDRLEDLRQLPGFANIELTCPVSKLPYVYNPIGIMTPNNDPRLICYDAAPSHSGMRWAIVMIEPQGSVPLTLKVVGVPENRFTLTMPR
jgi:hypothetical protein